MSEKNKSVKNLLTVIMILVVVLAIGMTFFVEFHNEESNKADKGSRKNAEVQDALSRDEVGKQLQLSDIDETSEGEKLICSDKTAKYWQASDGMCYTMLSDGERNYMLLEDDRSIGNFSLQDGYIAGFVMYKKEFYALKICAKETTDKMTKFDVVSCKWSLGKINLADKSFEELYSNNRTVSDLELPDNDGRYYDIVFCENNIVIQDGKDVFLWNIPTRRRTEISHETRFYKQSPEYTVYDNKLFYGCRDGNTVNLYYYDINNKMEKKFYSYKSEKGCQTERIIVKFDRDYLYVQDLAISRKDGEAKRIFTQAYTAEGKVLSASTDKNIYYIDKKRQVHSIKKKDLFDKIIYSGKASDVLTSKETLFIKKYMEETEPDYETDYEEIQNWDVPGKYSIVKVSENTDKGQKEKKKETITYKRKESAPASYFQKVYNASQYAQVYQGDYYSLRMDKRGNGYYVYKNGKQLLFFALQSQEILTDFTRYNDCFYLIKSVGDEDDSSKKTVWRVSERESEPKKCFEWNPRIWEDVSETGEAAGEKNMFLSEDKVWYVRGDFLYGVRITDGKVIIFQKAPSKMKRARGNLSFCDGRIYYGVESKKKVNLYYYDIQTETEKLYMDFQNMGAQHKNGNITMKKNGKWLIVSDYFTSNKKRKAITYLINSLTGKSRRIFKNAYVKKEISYCYNDKYLFYVDKKFRLCKYNLKNGTEKVIYKNCIGVDYVQGKLWVKEYKPAMEYTLEEEDTVNAWDCNCHIYRMTVDGKEVVKI